MNYHDFSGYILEWFLVAFSWISYSVFFLWDWLPPKPTETRLPYYLNHSCGKNMGSYLFQLHLCESECQRLGWNWYSATPISSFHVDNCYIASTSNFDILINIIVKINRFHISMCDQTVNGTENYIRGPVPNFTCDNLRLFRIITFGNRINILPSTLWLCKNRFGIL